MDDHERCANILPVPADGALTAKADPDAIRIDEKSRRSFVDSVLYSIECGRELAKKKESLKHGAWLPWLEANADVLGFSSRQTAARLLKLAKSVPENVASTQH